VRSHQLDASPYIRDERVETGGEITFSEEREKPFKRRPRKKMIENSKSMKEERALVS